MTNVVKTLTVEGKTLEIAYDEFCSNPRIDMDNLGTIVAWHSRYDLTDEGIDNRGGFREFLEFEMSDFYETYEGVEKATTERLMSLFRKENIILPVYMYEHGEIALSTTGFSCRWDSGQVGWIYVSKEKIREEYGVKRITKKTLEKVHAVLNDEIKTYGQYINGDVFSYVVKDEEEEIIDSCSGFYGWDFQNNGITEYVPNEFKELI